MKRMLAVLAAVMTAAASYGAEAVDWLSVSVVTNGGTINVPEGETAYVRTLDVRNDPLVKTGGGLLAVRDIKGSRKITVEGGEFATDTQLLLEVGAMGMIILVQ